MSATRSSSSTVTYDFRGSKAASQSLPIRDEELVLTADLVEELSADGDDPQRRLSLLRDLTPAVERRRLQQDHGVELLIVKTEDLAGSADGDARRCLLNFYRALIAGQFNSIDVMRAKFFRIVESHQHLEEDFAHVFGVLDALTCEADIWPLF